MLQHKKLPKGGLFLIGNMICSKFIFWQMGPYSSETDMNYQMEKRLLFWSGICFSGPLLGCAPWEPAWNLIPLEFSFRLLLLQSLSLADQIGFNP